MKTQFVVKRKNIDEIMEKIIKSGELNAYEIDNTVIFICLCTIVKVLHNYEKNNSEIFPVQLQAKGHVLPFNSGNKYGSSNSKPTSLCSQRYYTTMGIVKHQPIEENMMLKPEYLVNDHFKFLNNFGLQQQHLIADKKFVDINNRANLTQLPPATTRQATTTSACYIMPESIPKPLQNFHTKIKEEETHKEDLQSCCASVSNLKRPKKTKRSNKQQGWCNNSDGSQKASKKPKKLRCYRKASQRESHRNISSCTMSPYKQSKNSNKPWHKKSLKFEIMEIEDQNYEPIIESPAITEVTGCESMSKSPPVKLMQHMFIIPLQGNEIKSNCSPCKQQQQQQATAAFRSRLPSECESEDSFIIFDGDCQDSSDFETTDDESDDGSDETDGAMDVCHESDEGTVKKVRFAVGKDLCEVHPMVQWSFAYQKARKGPWEQYALDRMRFKKKICQFESILNPVLDAAHRNQIYNERFSRKCD